MPSNHANQTPTAGTAAITAELTAVVVAVTNEEPRVLTATTDPAAGALDILPSGPLEPGHRTLELGLRAWVERQTRQSLGYVEQLYTFGDRGHQTDGGWVRVLSIGYLALTCEARHEAATVAWKNWYRYFPWEDWRDGRPAVLDRIESALRAWIDAAPDEAGRRLREERLAVTFGSSDAAWSDERVLERYELLYGVGLVPEAHRDGANTWAARDDVIEDGAAMAADHRRILATAIGRLRAKIKYRPVVFELMPPVFTLSQLQRTVETLAGVRLHKPNFRRLIESQGLVEDTGTTTIGTGGRPARLVRFRRPRP